ncbi:MAG: STAS-like domain-containing protein [Microgenomates group bacterium]
MKKIIKMHKVVGDFAENKDVAKQLRVVEIIPSLSKGDEVILDFSGVSGATQSFIHALISDPIREFKNTAFDKLAYKNVNDNIREIISIVYRYMQESLEDNN